MKRDDILAAIATDNRFRASRARNPRPYEIYAGPLQETSLGRWQMHIHSGWTPSFTSAQIIETVATAEAREARQAAVNAERDAEKAREAEHRTTVLANALRDSKNDRADVDQLVASAEERYDTARKKYRALNADESRYEAFVRAGHEVAQASGYLQAAKEISTAFYRGGWANVALLFVEKFHQGADDTWTGRENDSNRVYHDGYRAAVSKVDHLVHDALWNLMSAHYAPKKESE